mmetsp:Transcript_32518/g.77270  ORF Transcript_32518/g.77270 Transcript_32518/m.77270 type:complete len:229 (+) Transcript_32518:73-759(+)
MAGVSHITKGQGDRTDRGHPQGSGKGWRPWKPQCTVAVTGVTERTKKTALQESFGEFGRIIRIEVPDGKTVAFVEYEERRDANDAIEVMNGKTVEGRRIGVRLVEDLPPKIDRNAPRFDEDHGVVHAPASGRANGPYRGRQPGAPRSRAGSGGGGSEERRRSRERQRSSRRERRSTSRRRGREDQRKDARSPSGRRQRRSRSGSGQQGRRRGSSRSKQVPVHSDAASA